MDSIEELDVYMDELKEEVGFYDGGYDNYSELFLYLFETNFVPNNELDENRISDVFSILRSPYSCLEDDQNVSILEMLIAMCIRIGEAVVGDEDTGKYFWLTLKNLGLLDFDDQNFDEMEVKNILDIWLNKQYDCDGKGSPWPIKNCEKNLRNVDIWRHFCMYIAEKFV